MKQCSRCRRATPRPGQRWCRACHAAYQREHRLPYHALPREQADRAIARSIANVYQRRGTLIPRPCERAGPDCRGPMEKHHDDYGTPLAVRWFCRHHHRQHEAAHG